MSNSMTSLRRCVAKYCYTYWFCCLLLSLVIVPTTAKLADQPDGSKKSHNKNEVVEGSGAFRGIAQHGEDPDWQAASGSSPDDEPGDDADDDDEHTLDGSGHMIEGSGYSRQFGEHSVKNSSSTQFTTTLQTTTGQAERQLIYDAPTSTKARPVNFTPTAGTSSVLQYTTAKTVAQTTAIPTKTTRAPVVVVNTRPPPQVIDVPLISEMEQPFEMLRPGILAAVSGGAVVGVLMTILLIMFIVYRMRKKDEGSYSLDEPHHPPNYSYAYQKASTKEFYA